MALFYSKRILSFLSLFFILSSCGTDDTDDYIEIIEEEPSPVVMNLDQVPYSSLSEYNFFEGDLKNLQPVHKVLPYDLNSSLFTDYALKKRFVWMPQGAKATYSADGEVVQFPIGAALIKNFYYEPVAPATDNRIIETRLLIRKAEGWIVANYVWNDDQTEAMLNMQGETKRVTIIKNGQPRQFNYKIPSENECIKCHKNNETIIPIGVKPQNLNKSYAYAEGSKNQLAKWIEENYLMDNIPEQITSTVNWEDTSLPLATRVRSYLDINCAHCHIPGGSCEMSPVRFSYSVSANPASIGVCVEPVDFINMGQFIVAGQDTSNSLMYHLMNSSDTQNMMPTVGRTQIHEEGVALITEWINSLDEGCQ